MIPEQNFEILFKTEKNVNWPLLQYYGGPFTIFGNVEMSLSTIIFFLIGYAPNVYHLQGYAI